MKYLAEKLKVTFLALIIFGLMAWCINGITVWLKAGQAIYALAGMQ